MNLKDLFREPGARYVPLVVLLLWALSGIYIVEPDEVGVVQRFGAFDRVTPSGPHYHIPWPVESASTPKVSQIRRVEIGFRTVNRPEGTVGQQFKLVPEESLMLTGDENIIDVQFIVQYQVKDAVQYLFNVRNPDRTVKDAAEAAMREVMGYTLIDNALTSGKLAVQNDARDRLQWILDQYQTGIRVVAVQLQDVHPPKDVLEAFKDVASAREDKSRFVNEAEAYLNDLLPRARGDASFVENQALAYRENVVRRASGESSRFTALAREYAKAPDVTRERLYIEAMETMLKNPELHKIILSDTALDKAVPYLPLERFAPAKGAAGAGSRTGQAQTTQGGQAGQTGGKP